MAKKFTWDAWDFDGDGEAYIIAKSECNGEDVADFICKADGIHPDCKIAMTVEEGWCKYECRSDWENYEGEQLGGYHAVQVRNRPKRADGRPLPGWFPVWIVRKDEWY